MFVDIHKCMCELYIWMMSSDFSSVNMGTIIAIYIWFSVWGLFQFIMSLSYWIHEQSNGLSFVKVFTVETTAPDQLYHLPVCSLRVCICCERFVISVQRFSLNLRWRCWHFHQRRWHLEKTNLFVLTDDRVIEIIMIVAVEEMHTRTSPSWSDYISRSDKIITELFHFSVSP